MWDLTGPFRASAGPAVRTQPPPSGPPPLGARRRPPDRVPIFCCSPFQVDDVPLNRAVLRATLTAAGASSIAEAADGVQAYELFRTCGGSATFPLILMDLSMPVCDGWTAASYIRSLERACGWPPCRIVACSSEDLSPGSPALARCWDVGMDAAVDKAVSRDLAAQLLQQYSPPSAFAAPSCHSSRNSEECSLADLRRQPSAAPSDITAASCATAAPDRSMSAPQPCVRRSAPPSPRSSMDDESSSLPANLRASLSSAFYRSASS